MADLVTLAEYKEAEGISSPKEDLRLSTLVPAVSQLVKTYCGNSLIDHYSTNKVETFSIDWDTYLVQLTESPVNTIVSVQKRDSVTESYSTVPTTDYYLDTATDSVLYVTGSTYRNWPRGAGAVKVTYTAGYASTPKDLKLAIFDLITYYLKDEHKERRTLGGASIQNQGSTSLRDSVAFPDHIKRVLDLYKNF
jgi:hypothetical protein|tara:strand:+ start:581 stop:1162 length:582 start_codon:yes stop_codon:yes gene_type:complete